MRSKLAARTTKISKINTISIRGVSPTSGAGRLGASNMAGLDRWLGRARWVNFEVLGGGRLV